MLSSWDYLLINPGLSWTDFTIHTHTHTHVFGHLNKIQDWICDFRWKACKINFKSLKVTELSFINLRSDLFWFLKRLKEIICDVKLGVQCHRSFWNGFDTSITVEGAEIFAGHFPLLSRSLICRNVLDFRVEQPPWFRILEEAIMFAASHRTQSLIMFAGDFGWIVSRMWRNPHNVRSFYDYFFNPPSSPLYSKRPRPSRFSIKFSHTSFVSHEGEPFVH